MVKKSKRPFRYKRMRNGLSVFLSPFDGIIRIRFKGSPLLDSQPCSLGTQLPRNLFLRYAPNTQRLFGRTINLLCPTENINQQRRRELKQGSGRCCDINT